MNPYVIARQSIYWRFPSSAERLALVGTPAEITKIAWQIDDNTLWMLIAAPGTWIEISTQGNGDYFTQIADGAIGGHRVVKPTTAGKVGYADKDTLGHGTRILGITRGAASDGANVDVQCDGKMSDSSFAWTPDAAIYCGAAGVLTQVLPVSGTIIQVGIALSVTAMLVEIRQPIVLS